MKIFVRAKAGAKEDKVTPPRLKPMKDQEEHYTVSVKEAPKEGI